MAAKYKNENIRYEQTNRIIEKFLYDLRLQKHIDFHLETCNVNAVACAIEGVNNKFYVRLPQVEGKNIISQADLIFFYIYQFDKDMPEHGDGKCENEYLENLRYAAEKLAHVTAKTFYTETQKDLTEMAKSLLTKQNCAIVVSYSDDKTPGHYITLVDVNDNGFIYYDPWGKNPRNKNGGNLELFTFSDFSKNNKKRMLVISDKN
jgi:hypothetical protein